LKKTQVGSPHCILLFKNLCQDGLNQSPETAIQIDVIHRELRPILIKIGNYADLNYSIIERLATLSRLFPNTFNLKLCDTLMMHLQEAIKKMIEQVNLGRPVDDLLKMSAAICEVFPLIQQAGSSTNIFENLLTTIVNAEAELGFALTKIHPHLSKFCCKLISHNYRNVLDSFLTEHRLAHSGWSTMLMNLLKCDKSDKLRELLEKEAPKLIQMGLCRIPNIQEVYSSKTNSERQFRTIEIMYLLAKKRPSFLTSQHLLLDSLKKIWTSPFFKTRYQNFQNAREGGSVMYREPVLIARIFLLWVQTIPYDCEFLFQLQRIHQMRTLAQFGKIKFWFKYEMTTFYTTLQQKQLLLRSVKGDCARIF
jgi:transformation/transcription domain-associated protein